MDLSISIVSYNTKHLLKQCIQSIYRNTTGIEFEIIVVDNASRDGSPKMVKSEFPDIKLIENRENLYFTRANNQAIKIAKGRYVLVLNSDTEIVGNTLKEMVDYLESNPKVGAITPKMTYPNGTLQANCSKFPKLQNAIFNYTFLRLFMPRISRRLRHDYFYGDWDRSSSKEVDVVPDSAIIVRKEILFRVGMYDEQFLLYYTEDDLCRRIKRQGWKIIYIPIGNIIHHEQKSVKKESARKISKIYQNDMLKYNLKYYGNKSYILVILVKITNALWLLCIFFRKFWNRNKKVLPL